MSWRSLLGIGLLLAALLTGWSAWRNRASTAPTAIEEGSTDFTLTDFEIVTLDKEGHEAVTRRAPPMARNRADQT